MRRILLAATLCSCIGVAARASADQPGADWLTKTQVTQKLKALGYSQVTKLEADDGHWEGTGLKDGKRFEFHVDPHSGALLKEEVDH